jgi:hypothetical protein
MVKCGKPREEWISLYKHFHQGLREKITRHLARLLESKNLNENQNFSLLAILVD